MGIPAYKLTALQELEQREAAAQSLPHYARYSLDVSPATHHELICSAIDDLLADRYDELIINSPPGSAKSTYTSHALPAYYLGRFPDHNVILATHTSDLSERWSRKVRNTVASTRHKNVFPQSELSQDSTAVSRWATKAGGELLAAGVGGSILGFRADLGVLDDPISGFEQAQSLTQLTKIHAWYETDFVTRLKPGAKTVLICQRLSPNDLAGYLIARNLANPTKRQRILTLRMVAECSAGCIAAGKAKCECDPLGRSPGDRLWPEWYTEEMVADAQRDDFKWRTLYQQRPPSEDGSWVSTEDICFRPSPWGRSNGVDKDSASRGVTTYGMSDLALSVNTGDYSVHLVVAIDTNGDWDIVDAKRARVDPNESATHIVDLCESYSPTEWLIDDDNASKVFGPLVATAAQARGVTIPWKVMPMRGQNKETRAAPLRGMYKRRKVYMPSDAHFTPWMTRELLTFPNAMGQGVDDGVDALGLLGRRLLAIAIPSNVIAFRRLPTTSEMTLDELFEDMPSRVNERI